MNTRKHLAENVYQYGFFQALRLLEAESPDTPRLGQSRRPNEDCLRLGQECSLRFAPSTLSAFFDRGGNQDKLTQNFMGLFGPNGPLPLHLTEYSRHRLRHVNDPTIVEFFDVFHHRLISLFYRAWADAQPTAQLDRKDEDRFGFYVNSLIGLAEPAMSDRDAMADESKRYFAGRLSNSVRNAEGLKALLQHHFALPVEIEEFVGEWLEISDTDYCYLNDDDENGQLGISAIAGTRSWQCQSKIRIKLGPMNAEQYEKMLPTGGRSQALADTIKNYIGYELAWDLNLILDKAEVNAPRLGESGQLGWTCWSGSEKETRDRGDLILKQGGTSPY